MLQNLLVAFHRQLPCQEVIQQLLYTFTIFGFEDTDLIHDFLPKHFVYSSYPGGIFTGRGFVPDLNATSRSQWEISTFEQCPGIEICRFCRLPYRGALVGDQRVSRFRKGRAGGASHLLTLATALQHYCTIYCTVPSIRNSSAQSCVAGSQVMEQLPNSGQKAVHCPEPEQFTLQSSGSGRLSSNIVVEKASPT
jgi:hypothetical protein